MVSAMTRRFTVAAGILAAVLLLAVAQAVLEDVSALAGWPAGPRQLLRLAGFFLDLFFTIEFLARLGLAFGERRAERYLRRERGWLDFLTGVPLLVLVSGPAAAGMMLGPTPLHSLALDTLPASLPGCTWVLTAVHVARALRLLRPARLAAGLWPTASGMAARHASLLALLGSAVLALGLAVLAVSGPRRPGLESELARRQDLTAEHLRQATIRPARSPAMVQADPSLLVVREGGATLYSRHPDAVYEREFAPGDYRYVQAGDLELFFDTRAAARETAAQSLLFQALVLLLLLVLYLLYAPHFARTVTDPLEVMRRGLAEESFNLEVRVPETHGGEEVFRLAREYNERLLPLKDRSRQGASESLLSPQDARLDEPGAGEG
jgi:hypothetical protein